MPADNAEEIADRPGGLLPPQPCRPNVMATRHAAATGHYLATHAAFEVLEAGGNAVDAGVAATPSMRGWRRVSRSAFWRARRSASPASRR